MATINTSERFTAADLIAELPEGAVVVGEGLLFPEDETVKVQVDGLTAKELRAAVAAAAARLSDAERSAAARAAAQLRLRELNSKGWTNLTEQEQAEVPQHALTLLAE